MSRETVLDRKVYIEKELIPEIPDVPPLCDGMEIWKQLVDIGDCKLYCEQDGEGVPVVILHGGPGATHHYFHPHFTRAKDFLRIIYYDQRGCGMSQYEKGEGYSLEQAVDDLDKLRGALQICKWIVLGHSYGGTLAQCYAIKYPQSVSGLVLVGSSCDGLPIRLSGTRQYDFMSEEEKKKIRQIQNNPNLSLKQVVFNAHLNGDWKRQNFYRPSRKELARLALYEWKHNRIYRTRIIRSLNALKSGNLLAGAFKECPIPVLLLEGKWDLTWSEEKPQKLQACFPGSRLVLFERSSHDPFADEPVKFFAALKSFVEDLPEISNNQISLWKRQFSKDPLKEIKLYVQRELRSEPSLVDVMRNMGYDDSAIEHPLSVGLFKAVANPSVRILQKNGRAGVSFGWYREDQEHQFFMDIFQNITGSTSPRNFDPGEASFGFYIHVDWTGEYQWYTEVQRNGGEAHVKVYPVIKDGKEIPNSYLLCWEDIPLGMEEYDDYQDIITYVSGVTPLL